MKTSLTPFAKLVIALFVAGAFFLAFKFFGAGAGLKMPSFSMGSKVKLPEGVPEGTKVVRIGVVTWGGYAGGQFFNEGFKANVQSRFYKDYGFLVDFVVLDDFVPSRDAWKADEIDLLWVTADAYTTEVEALAQYKPKFIFQADWSRGGDAIVAREGIKSVNELKGKKVSVAFGTPSHTFLIWLLRAAGMSLSNVEVVEAPSAIDSAQYFKAGRVDAAVVWSPDDEALIQNVPGSSILRNTKSASHIIADGFFVKEEYLNANREMLKKLVEGWLIGAAEINSSPAAKQRAAQILADGLNQPVAFTAKAIENVRLTTYGDNVNFFNVNGAYHGVTGEDIYQEMALEYAKIGLAPARIPAWRSVSDSSLIRDLNLVGSIHEGEGAATFSNSSAGEAFATKQVTVTYPSGSAVITDDAKVTIDREFGSIVKSFGNARVRIEGNTDSVGSREVNVALSKQRAQAVANFLVSRYGFDRSRFIIVGNGPDKPVADNTTEAGRSANRRTDFQLLQ